MEKIRLGYAICGSFCTFSKALEQLQALQNLGYDITPIMSEFAYSTNTRFGTAQEITHRVREITGKEIIHTIDGAEPIGPKGLLDILVIAPCTGNTLGKLAGGITDTAVTMACKAHLRNARPVVIAVSSNDALTNSGKNIGLLLNQKQLYFVPMRQDDTEKKPASIVADFSLLPQTVELALQGKQLQPMIK